MTPFTTLTAIAAPIEMANIDTDRVIPVRFLRKLRNDKAGYDPYLFHDMRFDNDGKELPDLLRHIEAYQGTAITRLAMKLMAMTFVRTSELIGARWAEIDLVAARWDIPAERMKMKTPHIVPLSVQAANLLKTLQLITGHSALLFPGERDHEKSMSNNTILKALERMGYKGRMTGHGFRGVASTLLHEMGFDHAHIELQLAHQERNEVSAAYNHATYLKQRGKMMQHWADYLDASINGKVLPFKRKTA